MEARANAVLFIEAMNAFYRETSFDQYFKTHDQFYQKALQEIRSKLPSPRLITAMEKFYRRQFHRYNLLPSLTLPAGMAFGVSHIRKNKIEIFNAFGPYGLQQFGNGKPVSMGFADEKHIRELSVHEFGHSFSNPVIDMIPRSLMEETKTLFDTIKTAMEDQGYNTWTACLYEHFVRAGEIIIAESIGYTKDAAALKDYYIKGRKFVYLPVVIAQLKVFEKDKSVSHEQAVLQAMEKLKEMTAVQGER